MNILFFGDSLTAGYGLQNVSKDSYPALIEQKIQQEGLSYKSINAGLSGDTTSGGLSRLNYWLSQPISVFVLELGVNDIFRGIPPHTTHQNLQSIVTKVKAKYPLVKTAMMGMEFPNNHLFQVAAAYRSIFRKVASDNNMAFVPFFLEGVAGNVQLNLKDGLHPTASGYKVIADNVWPVIHSLLL